MANPLLPGKEKENAQKEFLAKEKSRKQKKQGKEDQAVIAPPQAAMARNLPSVTPGCIKFLKLGFFLTRNEKQKAKTDQKADTRRSKETEFWVSK